MVKKLAKYTTFVTILIDTLPHDDKPVIRENSKRWAYLIVISLRIDYLFICKRLKIIVKFSHEDVEIIIRTLPHNKVFSSREDCNLWALLVSLGDLVDKGMLNRYKTGKEEKDGSECLGHF